MFRPLNQYHVVMEVRLSSSKTTEALQNIYLRSTSGTPIPLGCVHSLFSPLTYLWQ